MNIVMIVIASLVVALGWLLSLAGISGTWVILAAGVGLDVFSDWSWDFVVTTILVALLCALAEAIEFGAGLLGAKAFGGSRAAQVGAFLGTLGGGLAGSALIPIPLIGTVIGVIAGGFVGALLGEMRHQRARQQAGEEGEQSVSAGIKAGTGVMVAKILSIAMKAALSTLMIAWFVWIAIVSAAG